VSSVILALILSQVTAVRLPTITSGLSCTVKQSHLWAKMENFNQIVVRHWVSTMELEKKYTDIDAPTRCVLFSQAGL
jgi:hypothetical protein